MPGECDAGVPGALAEKHQIFGFQGTMSLRPCSFPGTGRSATSCLLSPLHVPGGTLLPDGVG